MGGGRIPWQEITGTEIYRISNQKMLSIQVKNPQALIKRQPLVKSMLLSITKGIWDAAVNIPQAALSRPLEELDQIIQDHLKNRSP